MTAIAAARALAQRWPKSSGARPEFSRQRSIRGHTFSFRQRAASYLNPEALYDPRLIEWLPPAVAHRSAMDTGVSPARLH